MVPESNFFNSFQEEQIKTKIPGCGGEAQCKPAEPEQEPEPHCGPKTLGISAGGLFLNCVRSCVSRCSACLCLSPDPGPPDHKLVLDEDVSVPQQLRRDVALMREDVSVWILSVQEGQKKST